MDQTSESELAFMAQGNCRNYPPDTMFPVDAGGVDEARKICAACNVASVCLEYALNNREKYGVWGGESERGRRRIIKQRRHASS